MYGRTFIFVENFHVNNLSIFVGQGFPRKLFKPQTFPDLR